MEGKRLMPSGHALQPDAEFVLLWSSNLDAKILNKFIDFETYLPCTLYQCNLQCRANFTLVNADVIDV
jgi:hypothetical protein